jgi:outer membrane protein OmpA-like peptidoglycan-associated protein
MSLASIATWAMLLLGILRPLHAQPGSAATRATDTSASKILDAARDAIRVENLSDLNSKEDDATCFIAPTDGSIYFTRTREGKQVLYVAKRLPGENTADRASHWSPPEVFDELPGKQNISSLSIANDGVTAVAGVCNRPDALFETCDIYQTELIDGKLGTLTPLGKPVNSEWWEGQPSISQDGQLLFFASDRKGGRGGTDIYMCSKTPEGSWSEPINLSFNTGGNELSPFISRDNQTLYFASDNMPGGLGGYDIYMTRRTGENEWTEPKNLGPSVNSKRDDLFFYIPPKEDAVYLSSNREGGMGNFDLYRIYVQPMPPKAQYVTLTGRILDAETNQPITTKPEIAISFSGNSQPIPNEATGAAYSVKVLAGSLVHIGAGAENFVSNSLEVQAPSTDAQPVITQDILLTPSHARIYGKVVDAFTNKPLSAKVMLEQLAGGAAPLSVQTDAATGEFTFNVNPLITYKLSTNVQDFDPYSQNVEVPAAREKLLSIKHDIYLNPVAIKEVVVFFDFDKSDLNPEELPKFGDFVRQVKENPHIRFEINGHTDSTGSIVYNQALSERRAKSVEDFLVGQEVPRDQIAVVQGFGKSHPLDPNDPSKNRRVEVRIVAKQD